MQTMDALMIRVHDIVCSRCGSTWQVSQCQVCCPTCRESPASLKVDNNILCGLHESRMLPCEMTGQFLMVHYSDEFMAAWKFFPNANIDPPPETGEPTVATTYCPVCQALYEDRWRSAGPE